MSKWLFFYSFQILANFVFSSVVPDLSVTQGIFHCQYNWKLDTER